MTFFGRSGIFTKIRLVLEKKNANTNGLKQNLVVRFENNCFHPQQDSTTEALEVSHYRAQVLRPAYT